MEKTRNGFIFFLEVLDLLDFRSFSLSFVLDKFVDIFLIIILVLQVKIFIQWLHCFGFK